MKRFFWLPVVALLHPATSFGQNSYTLQQSIDFALQNNVSAKNAVIDIEMQREKVKEITSIGLPQVNGEFSFQNFLKIPTTVIPAQAFNPMAPPGEIVAVQFGADYNVAASVTATQLLFDGSYFVGLKAAREVMDLQTLNQEKTLHDIRIEVMRAYYTAAVADENIKILEASIQNLEKLKSETEAIHKEGLIEQQDVDQFTLTVESMQTNLIRAKNMRDLAYKALKLQMGMDVNAEITLGEDVSTLSKGEHVVEKHEIDLNKTYEKMLLEQQLVLSDLNLRNKKMKALPSAGLFFTQQYNAQRFEFDLFANKPWYPATIWGFKVSIPIFSSFRQRHIVQYQKLENEKLNNTIKQVDEAQKMQAANAQLNLDFALQNLETQKKAMELASDIEQKTLVKYKEGMVGSMELNQAQTQFLSAQGNYIQALLTLFSAHCDVEKMIPEPTTNSNN